MGIDIQRIPQTAQTGQFPSDSPLRTRSFCKAQKYEIQYSCGFASDRNVRFDPTSGLI